jgi:hypothetical protein
MCFLEKFAWQPREKAKKMKKENVRTQALAMWWSRRYLNVRHKVPQRANLNPGQVPQANALHIKHHDVAINWSIDTYYDVVKHVERLQSN